MSTSGFLGAAFQITNIDITVLRHVYDSVCNLVNKYTYIHTVQYIHTIYNNIIYILKKYSVVFNRTKLFDTIGPATCIATVLHSK